MYVCAVLPSGVGDVRCRGVGLLLPLLLECMPTQNVCSGRGNEGFCTHVCITGGSCIPQEVAAAALCILLGERPQGIQQPMAVRGCGIAAILHMAHVPSSDHGCAGGLPDYTPRLTI
jgi:hypothetical protein